MIGADAGEVAVDEPVHLLERAGADDDEHAQQDRSGKRALKREDCPPVRPQQQKVILPHIRVDDWVFGVSAVSKDGFESPVASAVPGGAFKPWVKPAEPAK